MSGTDGSGSSETDTICKLIMGKLDIAALCSAVGVLQIRHCCFALLLPVMLLHGMALGQPASEVSKSYCVVNFARSR